MKVTEKKLDDNIVLLEAVASPAEVDAAFDMAALAFAQQMNLNLTGGIPAAQAAETQLGIKDLDMVINVQVPDFLAPYALDKKNIIPAYPPKAKSQTPAVRGKEFPFTAEVAIKPEYELTSYDPISITVQPFVINQDEVEQQLANLSERYADYVDSDPHPVGPGDHAFLEIKASLNGKEMPGLTTPGRTYAAGEGLMPPGFDENVIGMDVGETKTFTFEGPSVDDDYNEIVEVVECTVKVLSIQEKVLPTIDDAWVKKNMPMYANFDALRKELEDGLKEKYENDYENYKRNIAASELAKRFQGRIADEVYEATKETMLLNIQTDVAQAGMRFEDFIEQNGGEQQFNMMLMMQIRETLIQGYSLDALYRHEKMSLTRDDMIEATKTINPQQPEAVLNQMEKTGRGFAIRELAERMKANKFLLDNATVTVAEVPQTPSN